MSHRLVVAALTAALLVTTAAAWSGLTKTPAYGQVGLDTRSSVSAVSNNGTVVVAYNNGQIAIVAPALVKIKDGNPVTQGYIHTYRVLPDGQVRSLSNQSFDSDTGQFVPNVAASRTAP